MFKQQDFQVKADAGPEVLNVTQLLNLIEVNLITLVRYNANDIKILHPAPLALPSSADAVALPTNQSPSRSSSGQVDQKSYAVCRWLDAPDHSWSTEIRSTDSTVQQLSGYYTLTRALQWLNVDEEEQPCSSLDQVRRKRMFRPVSPPPPPPPSPVSGELIDANELLPHMASTA